MWSLEDIAFGYWLMAISSVEGTTIKEAAEEDKIVPGPNTECDISDDRHLGQASALSVDENRNTSISLLRLA